MLVRRVALLVALLCGFAFTQLPEFVEQYRQRLGGAIDELSAALARFDSDSQQVGLSESAGIARLRANADPIVKQRGVQLQEDVERLRTLRDAQAQFRTEAPLARLATFATHYDARIARGASEDFEPAVPTSPEALVLGGIGFIVGGGVIHMVGWPLRRRIRSVRRAEGTA